MSISNQVSLALTERTIAGKAVKTLRRQGYVPAVVYGNNFEPRNVMIEQLTVTKAYRTAGKHHPIELHIGKQKRLAMIKSVDTDPVKHTLRHLAFHVIKQNEKVETEVPIVITSEGQTPAERAGLVVLTTVETVAVSALPANLPDNIAAPGDKLAEAGDKLTVADLDIPEGVTILSEPEQVIAAVYEPSALAAKHEEQAGGAETEQQQEVPAENGAAEEASKESGQS